MATWAEVVAEITVQVNKAQAAKEIEQAVSSAKPEVTPTVNAGGVAEKLDKAVSEAHPEVTPGVNTAGMTRAVDAAVDEAHPEVTPGVNTAGMTAKVDEAVAEAHPEVEATVDEPRITREIDQAAAEAHPSIAPTVNQEHTASQVTSAVEKAPPATVPINTAGTGEKVEEGLRSANTSKVGAEEGGKFTGAFAAPVTALKGMVMGAVGAEAIMGGQQLFQTLITASGTAAKATKVVTEAIQTTGGAAGVTAEQIDKMAGEQARSTGVDKTAIQQSDALLLRYTNIRNAAGANNDVFNRTGKAALDMTAALNKGQVTEEGLTNTTKLLGRALEDPTKAAGVLRRSGIDLDKQQQDQIKTMVASNDTLGAQKVVLDAVNASYGGTAAATASGTAKMKAALNELEEELGKALLPLFTNLIKAVSELLDVLAPIAEWFNKGGAAAKILEFSIVGLVGAITLYMTTVKTVEIATRAWATVQALLNAELALNPIGLVVVAIAALTIGIIELYKHSQLFRDIVHETWSFIREIVIVTAHALSDALKPVEAAIRLVEAAWRALFTVMATLTKLDMAIVTTVIRVALAAITALFRAAAAVLRGIWKAEWDVMAAVVKTFGTVVLAVVRSVIDLIRGVIKIGLQLIRGDWSGAWHTMTATLKTVTGDWSGVIGRVLGYWRQAFSQAGSAVVGGFRQAWTDLTNVVRSGASAVTGAVGGFRSGYEAAWHGIEDVTKASVGAMESLVKHMISIFTDLPRTFESVAHGIATAFDAIKAGIHDPIAWVVNNPIAGLVKVFNTVGSSVHLPKIPDVHMAAEGMRVTGGTTETADDVLVRVSHNETILSAAHSRILTPVLAAVGVPGYRDGGVPKPRGFALGGLISGIGRAAGDVLSDVEQTAADAAHDAARIAGSVMSGVINGVVTVADKAIDAGQMAADLAVSKMDSLLSGFESIASMAAPGAEGWVKEATGGIVHQLADASVGELKGFAGVAARGVSGVAEKVFANGGLISETVTGIGHSTGATYRLGEAGPEWVTPAGGIPRMAAGGLLSGIPNLSGGLSVNVDGKTYQLPTMTDLQHAMTALSSTNSGMSSQLAQIGALLQQNPQQVATAIAQALNGVARLATAGAAYATR